MMRYQSKMLEEMPESSQNTKEAISAYQQTIALKSQEKLQALGKSLSDRTAELEESLDVLKPHADKVKDAIKPVPDVLKKLSAQNCPEENVELAKRSLKELNDLNKTIATAKHLQLKEPGTIQVGDSVRLDYVEEGELEEFVSGKVTNVSIGILCGIKVTKTPNPLFPAIPMEKETPIVIFPEKHNWEGPNLRCLTKSLTKAQLPFTGDRVRIKGSVINPHFAWRGVRAKKSRGTLKKLDHDARAPEDDLVVVIDFPEEKGWRGLYSEIELVPGCGFEIGDEVRVSSAIPEPSRGWAGVNGSSVGKVVKVKGVKGQEDVVVDFPECKNWIGSPSELEMIKTLSKGDKVQVKLSIKTPQYDWGGVNHQHVGVLMDIQGPIAQVRFPHKARWSCRLDELEPARYQPPDYGSDDYDDDDEQVDGATFLRLMMGLHGMM